MPNFKYTHGTGKTHDTIIDDEKCDMCYSQRRPVGKNMSDGTWLAHPLY